MVTKSAKQAIGQRFLAAFRDAGAVEVAPDILLDAATLLDLYGEDIRARAYVTADPVRGEVVLRPDFTVPVVRAHMETGAEPARYCYLGEVFRQRREGGSEFFQAGIEDLGETARAAADARSMADAYALLARVLPDATLTVTLGDQAVFEAVLAALGLPRGWRMRLARAFGSAEQLSAALADLAAPPPSAISDGWPCIFPSSPSSLPAPSSSTTTSPRRSNPAP